MVQERGLVEGGPRGASGNGGEGRWRRRGDPVVRRSASLKQRVAKGGILERILNLGMHIGKIEILCSHILWII